MKTLLILITSCCLIGCTTSKIKSINPLPGQAYLIGVLDSYGIKPQRGEIFRIMIVSEIDHNSVLTKGTQRLCTNVHRLFERTKSPLSSSRTRGSSI